MLTLSLYTLSSLLVKLVDLYTLVIFVYVMMSWIPYKQGIVADINDVLAKLCDPFLNIFKKHIPPIGGMIDISPIVAVLALQLVVRVIYIII